MNSKSLTIAALVMAALGGFLWWSNRQEETKQDKLPANAAPQILSMKEDAVQQIEIKPREGAAIVVKKVNGQWQITEPKQFPADSATVSGLLNVAASLNSDRMVDENPTDPAQYGLNPAAAMATFTLADGKKPVVRMGDPTPIGTSVYAMVEGDKRLFTITSSNKDSIAKNLQDLREKHLLTFEQDKISRVEFQAAGKTAVEFGRTGQNEWQILKPQPRRADGWQVEDILSKAKGVAMEAAKGGAGKGGADKGDDEKAAGAAFASAAPVATIKVTDANGVKSLEIRKAKDDVYAKSSTMEGAYKVNKDAAEGLAKSADDFRAKKIFDFGFMDPGRIEVKDKAKSLVVSKSGEKWEAGGKTMDSVGVQNLIDKLRDLAAAKFVESGFAAAELELTVTSNEGKRVEKIGIAAAGGGKFIAKRDGDTSLYELEGSVVADLRQSIDGVREPVAAAPDGKKK